MHVDSFSSFTTGLLLGTSLTIFSSYLMWRENRKKLDKILDKFDQPPPPCLPNQHLETARNIFECGEQVRCE